MIKIYRVYGCSGTHDDYQEWTVIAFKKESAAKKWVKLAQARAAYIRTRCAEKARRMDANFYSVLAACAMTNKYDLKMEMDLSGVKYRCEEIEVHG